MKRLSLRLITLFTLTVVFSLLVYGQDSLTSSLSGAVTDPTGAVIPGAQVTVKNNATSAEFKAVTVGNGTFSIPALDAGTYTVTISDLASSKPSLTTSSLMRPRPVRSAPVSMSAAPTSP